MASRPPARPRRVRRDAINLSALEPRAGVLRAGRAGQGRDSGADAGRKRWVRMRADSGRVRAMEGRDSTGRAIALQAGGVACTEGVEGGGVAVLPPGGPVYLYNLC